MANQKKQILPQAQAGFFQGLTDRIKLIYRLMLDRRVNPFLKLLPVGALVYWIIPDIVPGPIDDAFLLWLGSYLFVELCPPEIVQEHMEKIKLESSRISSEAVPPNPPVNEEEIVDAEFWEEEK
jgi:hypothetical protein